MAMVAVVVAAAGCSGHRPAEEQKVTDLTSTVVNLAGDEMIMGSPMIMTRVGDNMLLLDGKSDSAVHVVDLAAGKYAGQFLAYGAGPEEYLRPVLIAGIPGNNREFIVSEPNAKRFSRMEISTDSGLDIRRKTVTPMADEAWLVTSLADGRLVTTNGYVDHYELLTMLNPDGTVAAHYGRRPAPESAYEQPPVAMTAAYQYVLNVSPDGRKIAAIGSCGESAAFFRLEGDSVITVSDFCNEASLPNHTFANGNYLGLDNTSVMGYIYSDADADHVYVLISERTFADPDYYSGNRILIFGWDGNQTGEYRLDRRIRLFMAPDATGTIYAITEDGCDPTLVEFKLP